MNDNLKNLVFYFIGIVTKLDKLLINNKNLLLYINFYISK